MQKDKPIYHSIEEVFDRLIPAYGHTFKEYDVNHRLDNPNNKGRLGQIVEEGILGYPINSDPEADLAELGIEVKTTGVIATQSGEIRAKERLTIDALNYKTTVQYDFKDSLVWRKADEMLFVFYRYLDGSPQGDMPIIKAVINHFDEADVEIMRQDYDYIVSMIRQGRAEDISEGDTMYLGACTAGTGALVEQPFSSIKAKQRKFCLKQPYFTQLIRKYISNEEFEHVLDIQEIREASFEAAMVANLERFYGLSEIEIRQRFAITDNPEAKNRYERYLAAMLGVRGKISDTDEFQKAGIQVKTIRVNQNGSITESMSFPHFHFTKIVEQDWEESDLRAMFAGTKFMFVIYYWRGGELYFERIKFWHMPEKELDSIVKPVFEKVKQILLTGNVVKRLKRLSSGKIIRETNFPGMADNPICHVRPHGRDANDTLPLPVPDRVTGVREFTKQCFWLNSSYVADIIESDD